jgi:hypothetical protein
LLKVKQKKSKNKPKSDRVARTGGIPDICAMIDDREALGKALDTLVELLGSVVRHYDPQTREHELAVDGATRTKAAQILIEQRVGQAVKRQQIITGKMESPVIGSREDFAKLIDEKIYAMVNRPDVTLSELFAAKRSVVEDDKKQKMEPLNEAQLLAEARRIHGMADEQPAPPAPIPEG